ncbi:MAG: phosphoglycerate mutase [Hyphomicrobiales bacterium]|nr:phosphoglycerate mutase [Hyphomicrobiales bacterium]
MLAHRLVFIRHGETDWNVEGRLQGQQDIPLNARGRHQAAQAGKTTLKLLGREALESGAYKFICSPLGRARETMEIARAAMGLPPGGYAIDRLVEELTFGEWEGLVWPEVKARAPEAANWREGDKWNFTPPGGESYAMLAARLTPWLESLTGDSIVVSHGGVARALMAMLGGLPQQRAALADIWQGRVIVFANDRYDWV